MQLTKLKSVSQKIQASHLESSSYYTYTNSKHFKIEHYFLRSMAYTSNRFHVIYLTYFNILGDTTSVGVLPPIQKIAALF